jgi:serine/threonine protein kinase
MTEQNKTPIVELIDNDELEEAFDRTFSLFKELEEFHKEIAQFSSQHQSIRQKELIGTEHQPALSVDNNRIRFHFRKSVKNFHEKVLPQYFEMEHFQEEVEGVASQEDLLVKIMRLRLEPMGYQIEKDKTDKDTVSRVIHGKSALLIPLSKNGSNLHALAQVLRKSYITKEEKEKLKRLIGLKHRNVIKVLDCEAERYPFFLVREHIYGRTLKDAIKSVGPRPASQVIDWMYQLADALLYLNQKGIYHFNLRPSKIHIDDELHVMLSPIDLTASTDNTESEEKKSGDTKAENKGTTTEITNFWEVCKYGSPEMLKDYGPGKQENHNRRFVCAADQYSLGVIAFYALTGEELFPGDTLHETLQARNQFEKDPAPRLKRIPHFETEGAPLVEIISRLLNTDPAERYSSLHSLIKTLHNLVYAEFEGASTVQKSYRRALANNRELIKEFYKNLIEESDKINKIFGNISADKRKMNRQYAMLQMAIDIIIHMDEAPYQEKFDQLFKRSGTVQRSSNTYADRSGKNIQRTEQAGTDQKPTNPHAGLKINDYAYFIDKFIETVKESDPEFNDTDKVIITAWRDVKDEFIEKLRIITKEK